MKKNYFCQFALLFILCQFGALFASAQANKLVINVTIPGQPVFQCISASGPPLKLNSIQNAVGSVTIVKSPDKYDSHLSQVKAGSTRLTSVVIDYYSVSANGQSNKIRSIQLNDVSISQMLFMQNQKVSIAFVFKQIEWTYRTGGKTESDAWDTSAN